MESKVCLLLLKMLLLTKAKDLFAFEYRMCPMLNVEKVKRGSKLVLTRCLILRGLLALVPENVKFIGGDLGDAFYEEEMLRLAIKAEQENRGSVVELEMIDENEMLNLLEQVEQESVSKKLEPSRKNSQMLSSSEHHSDPPKRKKRFLDDSD